VRASVGRRRKALVIASDIARYELRSPGEPTQGAGAVAMLVGNEPRVLTLEADSGTYAANVYDFWRPFGRREALVDGKFSVECYLDALAGAFTQYRALERPQLAPEEALSDRLARLLYHTPFPKMAVKAHRRLIELDWRAAGQRWAKAEPTADDSVAASFRELAATGIEAVSHIGNTYTASLYLCLAGLLEREARALAGRRVGLFSYGSGCCAEFFAGTVPNGVESAADAGLRDLLKARTMIDVAEYERLMTGGEAGGEPPSAFAGEFVFRGVRNDRREYGRLRASMAA